MNCGSSHSGRGEDPCQAACSKRLARDSKGSRGGKKGGSSRTLVWNSPATGWPWLAIWLVIARPVMAGDPSQLARLGSDRPKPPLFRSGQISHLPPSNVDSNKIIIFKRLWNYISALRHQSEVWAATSDWYLRVTQKPTRFAYNCRRGHVRSRESSSWSFCLPNKGDWKVALYGNLYL